MPSSRVRSAGVALLLALVLPAGATAQEGVKSSGMKISQACSASEFRDFDYWLGSWVVTDTAGTQVGTNHVVRVSDGCALLEQWTDSSGNAGTSLNFYDRNAKRWEQTWMGAQGGILHLRGSLVEGTMTLSGTRTTAQGEVTDRIQWIRLDGGRVRQLWSVSTDGGRTWKVAFNGVYSPSKGGT